jgi:hypothetical protein
MKKLLFIAIIAIAGLGKLNAQEQIIKINPLAILRGTDLVSYERAIGEKTSFQISGAIGGFEIGDTKYTSIGAGAQYRFYFEEALKGLYAAADVSFQGGSAEFNSLILPNTKEKTDFTSLNIGGKVGHQWIWENGFSFELNLGIGYRSFNYDTSDTSALSDLKGSGILPSFRLSLGYAF